MSIVVDPKFYELFVENLPKIYQNNIKSSNLMNDIKNKKSITFDECFDIVRNWNFKHNSDFGKYSEALHFMFSYYSIYCHVNGIKIHPVTIDINPMLKKDMSMLERCDEIFHKMMT